MQNVYLILNQHSKDGKSDKKFVTKKYLIAAKNILYFIIIIKS